MTFEEHQILETTTKGLEALLQVNSICAALLLVPTRLSAPGSKIRDAYNFIAQNYDEGDEI
jgi:uncharacterized protein (DUF2235 family)